MRFISCLVWAAAVCCFALAQQAPTTRRLDPIRIPVRHADPWYIVAMLRGVWIISPELSTVLGFMGIPEQAGQAANALFSGGRLMVNPTDNSIWFFPDR